MRDQLATSFLVSLKREMWESRNLFIASPLVITGIISVGLLWALFRVPGDAVADLLELLSGALRGLWPSELPPVLLVMALPFLPVFAFCALIYLVNALYQDRKDNSILFWQSLPVSNLQTVLAKLVTVSLVAPLFIAAAIGVLFLLTFVGMLLVAAGPDMELSGLGTVFFTGLYQIVLIYLTLVLAVLWLTPTVGWLLLFSAYARNLPFLWAGGAFMLLLFVEDILFTTQYLTNWVQNRTNFFSYVIYGIGDFFLRLVSYDMLIGLALGSLLIAGAVYMRRFTD
jgi:ABC-2 type transport system permease protein